jgi:hypothetical protein
MKLKGITLKNIFSHGPHEGTTFGIKIIVTRDLLRDLVINGKIIGLSRQRNLK